MKETSIMPHCGKLDCAGRVLLRKDLNRENAA